MEGIYADTCERLCRKQNASVSTAIASVLAASSAMSQESGGRGSGLEEIVVTATRREEALQDVPLAVTAMTADSLVARGISSLGDPSLARFRASWSASLHGTPSVLALSVRGVGLSDPTQGTTEMTVPLS